MDQNNSPRFHSFGEEEEGDTTEHYQISPNGQAMHQYGVQESPIHRNNKATHKDDMFFSCKYIHLNSQLFLNSQLLLLLPLLTLSGWSKWFDFVD